MDMKKSPFNLIIYPLFLLSVIILIAMREVDLISIRLNEKHNDGYVTVVTASCTKYEGHDIMNVIAGIPYSKLSQKKEELANFIKSLGAGDLARSIEEFTIPALPNILQGASSYVTDNMASLQKLASVDVSKATEQVKSQLETMKKQLEESVGTFNFDDLSSAAETMQAQKKKLEDMISSYSTEGSSIDVNDLKQKLKDLSNMADGATGKIPIDSMKTQLQKVKESVNFDSVDLNQIQDTLGDAFNTASNSASQMYDWLVKKSKDITEDTSTENKKPLTSFEIVGEENMLRRTLTDASLSNEFIASLNGFMTSDLKKVAQNPGSYTLSKSNALVADNGASNVGTLTYAAVLISILAFTFAGAPIKYKTVRVINNGISIALVIATIILESIAIGQLKSWANDLCEQSNSSLESNWNAAALSILILDMILLFSMSVWVFVKVWLRPSRRQIEDGKLLSDSSYTPPAKSYVKESNKKEKSKSSLDKLGDDDKNEYLSESKFVSKKNQSKKRDFEDSEDVELGKGRKKKNLLL